MLLTIAAGILIIITFPVNQWWFKPGVDEPLLWLYNYFASNGFSLGKEILFPHGPLAFLMYPLKEQIVLTRVMHGFLITGMWLLFAHLIDSKQNSEGYLTAFLLSFIIALVAPFTHILLANVLLLYALNDRKEFAYYRFLIALLTAWAFYIKAYIAILTGLFWVGFQVYDWIRKRNYRELLIQNLVLLAFVLLGWLLLYGQFNGFFRYLYGMIQLSSDNSAAAAYYPHNNGFLLLGFLLATAALFWINRKKITGAFPYLLALGLFGAWKHGMARQDLFHTKGLFLFILIGFAVFIALAEQKRLLSFLASMLALLFFSLNMIHAENYFVPETSLMRSHDWYRFVFEGNSLQEENAQRTKQAIHVNRVSEATRTAIGNATVDAYPWDYSLIPANDFRFKPRVIPHSYAAYTSWLDEQEAIHFRENKGADVLAWQYTKRVNNLNGGLLNSIDDRYLLNDQPQTILEIISRYQHFISDGDWRFYKKRAVGIPFQANQSEWQQARFLQWVSIPPSDSNKLQRIKLKLPKAFLARVKSFWYKDDPIWIYLRTTEQEIMKYRIVPRNAADGLWINPHILAPGHATQIEAIMLFPGVNYTSTSSYEFQWEEIDFEQDALPAFFEINRLTAASELFRSSLDFESAQPANWSERPDWYHAGSSFKGERCQALPPDGYSSTFQLSLDSIGEQSIEILAEVWSKLPVESASQNISLVISIENDLKTISWQSIPFKPQWINDAEWNHFSNRLIHFPKEGERVKVFVWNQSKDTLLLDNFQVSIKARSGQ